MIRRALHRLAQWCRRVRWHYHVAQAAFHLGCNDAHQRMAEEVWLGKGNSRRQRKSETHS